MDIQYIVERLLQDNIKHKKGAIHFELAGISFQVASKDIIGGVL